MKIRQRTLLFFLLSFCFVLSASYVNGEKVKPNIIVVVVDDLGWDDVGYHGSKQVKTPNIDLLASRGIKLDSHYVNPLCSPSRASLLTGRYPSSLGLQHSVIIQGQKVGVPLNESMLSEYLRPEGYETHAIGKWHLGYFAKEYTPTGRGFDSFYGYYNENNDYYDHTSSLDFTLTPSFNPAWGLDWHYDVNGTFEFVRDEFGQYSTDLLTNRAIEVLKNYSHSETPIFMYLAYQSVHSGNQDDPLQAPQDDINQFPDIYDTRRRKTAGMIYNLDRNLGRLYQTMESGGFYSNNTYLLFLTDNGGPTLGCDFSWASNYPLRGSKHTLFQGGVRGVTFLSGPEFSCPEGVIRSLVQSGIDAGGINNKLMHVADWVPTFLEAAGVEAPSNLDGVSQLSSLTNSSVPSARSELLLNIDQKTNYSALIVGDLKLMVGKWHDAYLGCKHNDAWYNPPGDNPMSTYVTPSPTVKCNGVQPQTWDAKCWSTTLNRHACMFNVLSDPCEYVNIIDDPSMVENRGHLLDRLEYYYTKAVEPRWPIPDLISLPPFHNYTWTFWTTDTSMD